MNELLAIGAAVAFVLIYKLSFLARWHYAGCRLPHESRANYVRYSPRFTPLDTKPDGTGTYRDTRTNTEIELTSHDQTD